jgi:hypothetical protein
MSLNLIRNTCAAVSLTLFTLVSGASLADDVKIPETAADHEALAKTYKDQAAQYRKTSEDHKKMAAAYKKNTAPEVKGQPNPWAQKMAKHCAALSKSAEKLAADADKAAEFHTFRAKETQGK